MTRVSVPEIIPALGRFLEKKFLFWLEILSVLGTVGNAVEALQTAMIRLKVRWVCVPMCSRRVYLNILRNRKCLSLQTTAFAS